MRFSGAFWVRSLYRCSELVSNLKMRFSGAFWVRSLYRCFELVSNLKMRFSDRAKEHLFYWGCFPIGLIFALNNNEALFRAFSVLSLNSAFCEFWGAFNNNELLKKLFEIWDLRPKRVGIWENLTKWDLILQLSLKYEDRSELCVLWVLRCVKQ